MSREFVYQPVEMDPIAESDLTVPHEQTIGESREMIRESINFLLACRSEGAKKNSRAHSLWDLLLIESPAA